MVLGGHASDQDANRRQSKKRATRATFCGLGALPHMHTFLYLGAQESHAFVVLLFKQRLLPLLDGLLKKLDVAFGHRGFQRLFTVERTHTDNVRARAKEGVVGKLAQRVEAAVTSRAHAVDRYYCFTSLQQYTAEKPRETKHVFDRDKRDRQTYF